MPRVVAAGLPAEWIAALQARFGASDVYAATGGEDALRALGDGPCDLLILNDVLESPDAADVLDDARQRFSSNIRILYCVSDLDTDVAPLGSLARPDRVLLPPLDEDLLIAEVDAILETVSVPLPPPSPPRVLYGAPSPPMPRDTPSATEEPAAAATVEPPRVETSPLEGRKAAPPMPRPARTTAAAKVAIAQLFEKHREAIMQRLDVLDRATVALMQGRLDPDLRRAAETDAHKLAGSLGSFGFPTGSTLAREAELQLEGDKPLDPLRMSDLVVALRSELEKEVPAPPSPLRAPSPAGPRDMLAVGLDVKLVGKIELSGATHGWRTTFAPSVSAARDWLAKQTPSLLLLDISNPTETPAALSLMTEVGTAFPVLVLTQWDAFDDRLEVARAGGQMILQKPLQPDRVLDAADALLDRYSADATRILMVDDDPVLIDMVRTMLSGQNIQLRCLLHPRHFWDEMRAYEPQVLLLDLDMPHASGIELCRVVRADPRWAHLPILFLTARQDAESVRLIFQAGADDYMHKPVDANELIGRIDNRIERARQVRLLGDTDPVTGLPYGRNAQALLTQMCGLARHHNQDVACGLFRVEGADTLDPVVVDASLRRLVHLCERAFALSASHDDAERLLARGGGADILVAVYGTDSVQVFEHMKEVLVELKATPFTTADGPLEVNARCGLAFLPHDAREADGLLRAAAKGLETAELDGVGLAGGPGAVAGEAVDVVLVDDDAALVELLRHALESKGHSVRWIDNGEKAVAALSGPAPSLRSKVVVLDVGLPGMNGLSALRTMARDGPLRRSRVVMLTARTEESEVLEAMELGAFDHVAKPFSVPVLMQRLKRALEF